MPVNPELLEILVCPETRQPVAQADALLLAKLNAEIEARSLRNRGGEAVAKPIEEGLLREDGKVLYVVDDGIPVMLVEESIEIPELTASGGASLRERLQACGGGIGLLLRGARAQGEDARSRVVARAFDASHGPFRAGTQASDPDPPAARAGVLLVLRSLGADVPTPDADVRVAGEPGVLGSQSPSSRGAGVIGRILGVSVGGRIRRVRGRRRRWRRPSLRRRPRLRAGARRRS